MADTILIVDDDEEIGFLVSKTLELGGFCCHHVLDAESAMAFLRQGLPAVLVLDVEMPGMNGLELCQRLKSDAVLSGIPVLMLTGRGSVEDRVEGLSAGADDYLGKPFDSRELVARVEALLRISRREAGRNPTSGLPGPTAVDKAIEEALRQAQEHPFVVMHLDIDNFKAFSDHYGFHAADDVIRSTAMVARAAVKGLGIQAFVGHLGGDDFIILTGATEATRLGPAIVESFDRAIRRHFSEEDLKRNGFTGRGRDGRFHRFPITSLSVAAVSSKNHGFVSLSDVSEALVEIKRRAKARKGSVFLMEEHEDILPPESDG